MSARGKDHKERKPMGLRKPPAPGDISPDDEPIEILEVVGVDETTGTVVDGGDSAAPEHPERPHRPETRQSPQEAHDAVKEKDKYYDLLLRKQAEFENFRKRMEKERDEARRFASADLVKRLLPVLDNLERAIGTGQGGDDPLHKGIALIHQQILEVFRKEGLQPLETLGVPFDPRHHEAVEVLNVDRKSVV